MIAAATRKEKRAIKKIGVLSVKRMRTPPPQYGGVGEAGNLDKETTMFGTTRWASGTILLGAVALILVSMAGPGYCGKESEEGKDAKAALASEDPSALNDEAVKLYNAGKYAEAIPFAERSLAILEKTLGPEHPDVATSLENLAALYEAMVVYAKAEPLYHRALAIREKSLGQGHPGVAASLNGLAGLYYAMGAYAKAEPLFQRSLAIREKNLGPEHPDVATSLNDLAALYEAKGAYAKVEPLYQRALTIWEKALGPEHPYVATSLNNLAALYHTMGAYAKAEPLLQRSLAIKEKALGPEHPDVALGLNNLAKLYNAMGAYAKAEPFFQRSLAIREKNLGPEHPDVAQSLNNLAGLYEDLCAYAKAEPLYLRALAIYEKGLGPEHRDVATSLSSLAVLYDDMGAYAKAEPLLQRSLAIREKNLGPEHPDVAQSLNNLAGLYKDLGAYAKAEPLYLRALAIYEKGLGPEHQHVATSLSSLAVLYDNMGAYAKAEPLKLRSLTINEKNLGPEHPDVATSLNNLAALYYAMGAYAKAEPLYLRSLAIREKTLGPEHSHVATSLSGLAGLYNVMGAYAKAEPLYLRALVIREKVLGPEHPDVATSLNNLASLYYTMGAYAKAETLLQRALAIWEKALGAEHPTVAAILNNLAALYDTMGTHAKAGPLIQRALAIREKTLGPEHPDVATTLNNLAGMYYRMDAYAKAEPFFQRSLAIREKKLGPDHPDVAWSLNNLAKLYEAMGQDAKAAPLYQRALPIVAGSKSPELVIVLNGNLSRHLAKAGAPEAAIFFGKQAVNSTQALRAGLVSMDKELQKSFLADRAKDYHSLADLLVAQGRIPEAQQVLAMLKEEEYFDFVRRDAAEAARSTVASYTGAEKALAERYDQISGRLVALTSEKDELVKKQKLGLSPEESARLDALRADLDLARGLFNDFVAKVSDELTKAGRAKDVGEKKLASLEALQGVLEDLGEGAVFLHYLVTEDKVWMILTTPKTQDARSAPVAAKDLNAKIMDFRKVLEAPTKDPIPQARALYELLWAPVAADLAKCEAKTVMVFLDGVLRYIPLAALHDRTGFLAEKYALPVFTAAAEARLTLPATSNWKVVGFGVTQKHGKFAALSGVKDELAGIVKADAATPGTQGVLPGAVRLDAAFTEQSLSGLLAENYSVVHIASHFDFNPGTIEDSALLLGDGKMLTLAQLKKGDFQFKRVDLLTLSACNTGMGGVNADGREVEGFGVLAQNRGAKGVLATLWPVADTSTGLFMQDMYWLHQERHLSKAEALRQEQVRFIKGEAAATDAAGNVRGRVIASSAKAAQVEPDAAPWTGPTYAHPYYWAPFILMGNWL